MTMPDNLPVARATTPVCAIPRATRWLQGLGIYGVVMLLCLIGVFVSPQFFTAKTFLGVLEMVSLLGIVAMGLSFVTYSGHYADLSIPMTMSVAGFVAVSALPLGFAPAMACGIVAGMVIGWINGLAIGYLRLNPIIWTLAMAFVLDGVLRGIFSGNQVYPDMSNRAGRWFLLLAQYRVLKFFPLATVAMLILMAAGHGLMKWTRFGSQVQLTGASYEVARFSGVGVRMVVLWTFVASSTAAAIAGLFATSLNQAGGFEVGRGIDFKAVTAVVLGGVGLAGGSGSVVGVFGGVLVMGLLSTIMDLAGVGYEWKMVVTGVVFIAVVGATGYFDRKAGRGDG